MRITQLHLTAKVEHLNRLLGLTDRPEDKFYISLMLGKSSVVKGQYESHVSLRGTKKETFTFLDAMIKGIEFAKYHKPVEL